jgi:hypothetical protein
MKPGSSRVTGPIAPTARSLTQYALRADIIKTLSFILGADDGDATRFGNEYKNGIAAVSSRTQLPNEVLFDTGWVTCKYSTRRSPLTCQ